VLDINFFLSKGIREIGFFLVIWLILWLPIALPLAKIVKWNPWQPFSVQQKLVLVSSLYVIAPIIIWFLANQKGLTLGDYGLIWGLDSLISLSKGFILGISGLFAVFLLEFALKLLEFKWENINKLWSISLPILLLGLFISVIEELIFRGFFLTELNQNINIWISAVISSVIFAILHLIWEQKQTLPQIPGLFFMGIVLVIARLFNDGNLSLAIGLHSSWIFGLTCLDSLGLIVYQDNAPQWLIGINKQPLAGVSGLICLLITGLILVSI
jgi:uncharacterized protein